MRKVSINNSRPLLQHDPDSDLADDETPVGRDDEDEYASMADDFSRKLLPVPRDRFHFTYITFYLLGMTTLMPWNFFVTPEDVSMIFSSLLCIFNFKQKNFKTIYN